MPKPKPQSNPAPALFTTAPPRHRNVLILPRFLAEEADKQAHRDAGPDLENARAILDKWAEKEAAGHWGIVSNFSTIRLYHRDRGTRLMMNSSDNSTKAIWRECA